MNRSARQLAALVSAAYLTFGLVWIRFSDEVGGVLFSESNEALTRYQTYKGLAFVAATAVLLFLLLDRRYRKSRLVQRGPGLPLSLLLTLLVLSISAPLLVLLGYNIVRDTRGALREAQALVVNVAGGTASDITDFFVRRQKLFTLLVREAIYDRGSAGSCRQVMAAVESAHDNLMAATVDDAEGQALCRQGDELLLPQPPLQLSPQGPRVGKPFQAGGSADWLFPVAYPVTDGGRIVGAVRVTLRATSLRPLLAAPLPEGSAMTLLDADGTVLARLPEAGLVGTHLQEGSQFHRLKDGKPYAVRGRDGVERVYAVRAADGVGLFAVAGVSSSVIYRPAQDMAVHSLLVALLVLLGSGFFIARLTQRIAGPMVDLARTAELVARGSADVRAPEHGPAEVARVATEFNRMLDRLPALESELRTSEARHRSLLDKLARNIPGMIFEYHIAPDGRGTLPFASRRVLQMFEVAPEDAARDAALLLQRIHPDDAPRVAQAMAESTASMANCTVEYRVVLPVQGERHYLSQAQPERQADGAVLLYGCTVDITDVKLAQDQLQLLKDELELRVEHRTDELRAAFEALESFSYSVAHDLRAPLQAINGFAGALPMLVSRGEKDRAERLLGRIIANGRKMMDMIDGLLALARLDRSEPNEKPHDLGEMARNVVQELHPPATIHVAIGALPTAEVDAVMLRQVWWNLLGNAIKFTAGRERGRIEVGVETRGSEAVFHVRDNGAGFDASSAQRLFEVFSRLHPEAEFEGTGVGLAIVRRVVQRHGGRVWAEGRPGEGATFYFTLPAERLV